MVIGRRGPLQAPFTTLELRELGDLEGLGDVDVIVDPADFADITDEDLEAAGKTVRNNIKVLRGYAEQAPRGAKRRIVFRFRTSPIEIKGDGQGRVDRVGPQRTGRRRRRPRRRQGHRRARGGARAAGGPRGRIPRACRRPGCRSTSAPAPFRTPTAGSRAAATSTSSAGSSAARPGVIGSNKSDSQRDRRHPGRRPGAAELDRAASPTTPSRSSEWLLERQPKLVTDDHWKLIDDHERTAGEGPAGRG